MLALFAFVAALVPFSQTCAQSSDPIPLEVFALREVIQQVSISPDGKLLALMKIDSRKGDPIVEIYETDDLSKRPYRLAADPMEFTSIVGWVSDDYLVFAARQRLRRRIQGFNRGVFAERVAVFNYAEKKFDDFGNATIENLLPQKEDTILISTGRAVSRDDPFAQFRPRAYYELNLKSGGRSLVLKGNDKVATAQFDPYGNPRAAFGLDNVTDEQIFYGRLPGENNWTEVYRRDLFNFVDFTPTGYKKGEPSTGYVISLHNGSNVYGLWEFDWTTGKFGDLVFQDDEADVQGVITHPNVWSRPGEVIGVTHYGPKPQRVFWDEEVATIYAQLEEVVPNAYNLSITSMSRDGGTYIVFNRGPRDPGSYYMIRNGGIQFIGGHAPLIKPEQLADVEFVEYTARDGRKLRGYITIPNGEPPFPTVNMPHGGPFVGEMPDYDEWAQVMASRGYLVFQPQFLASRGWGHDHYIDFLGEYGAKMSDDKDDGIKYLIDRGLTDPDRVAMFGWSYGGYAAAAAAIRQPQIYQCTIPAAATLDIELQKKYNQESSNPASDEFAERRYNGLNPVENADKVNVPILLIHGDVDQRVPFEHFKRFTRAMEQAGKADMMDTLVLKEADHFYNTLYYRHQIAFYEKLTDYLANDCGPGGL